MSIKILPYRAGSRGARELADAIGGRVLRLQGSRYVPRRGDVIINWGNATGYPFQVPRVLNQPVVRLLNEPGYIRDASNKLNFFRKVHDDEPDIIPRFWTSVDDIPQECYPIVCRTVLAGHSGEGIVIANNREEIVRAPLYVQYIKKQDEYRVHVGRRDDDFTIIDTQQKKRRQEHENPNWQVRNLANGFIYAREGVNAPVCVTDVARRALACTDLDFGAVDVIYNARENRAYVLEINTAPGITGTTVQNYVDFFRNY